jgi:hypothetical protein
MRHEVRIQPERDGRTGPGVEVGTNLWNGTTICP